MFQDLKSNMIVEKKSVKSRLLYALFRTKTDTSVSNSDITITAYILQCTHYVGIDVKQYIY